MAKTKSIATTKEIKEGLAIALAFSEIAGKELRKDIRAADRDYRKLVEEGFDEKTGRSFVRCLLFGSIVMTCIDEEEAQDFINDFETECEKFWGKG